VKKEVKKKICIDTMKKRILYTLLFLCIFHSVNAQTKSMLLLNGFLHVGNEKTIESAAVGIRDGKISLVRNALAYSFSREDWDTIIDLKGQHIYPGFIAGNSTLGLTEIDAVRATRDYSEVGEFNPHIRSQIAYNVESKVISTVRTNGILLTQATPRGGQISGTSSLMSTSGWNWEDATILADDGIHVNWPSSLDGGGWWAEPSPKKKNEAYEKEKQSLTDFFAMSKSYVETAQEKRTDLRLNAMSECFVGEKRVYFHADDIQQLLDIIDFAVKFDLKYPVIVGGYDSHLITRKLKDAKIPVMLNRIHSLPENETDAVDLPYRIPALLQEGGVKFCIQNHGEMEAMNTRNLPFQAGTAQAYGLTEEQAIRSISLSACEIIGIGKQYGSIEEGKSATLFISTGNALDIRSNNITLALINGQMIDLTNFQEELYNRYSSKYKK